jgi:uncharacterized protein YjiS (DUF1127 family)
MKSHIRSVMTIGVLDPVSLTAQAARMFRIFSARRQAQRTIGALRELDDHILVDIGLTRRSLASAIRSRGGRSSQTTRESK